eukprot:TRINITY_DN2738_c0_g1_i2.p1 TRINITY_DN2738_c0_g1~~TRINITY_DN2738_c0_g1_i2.p1  ORF type:complete len:424 (-),score=46.16 TRINITY_DN2738_c0_g1_i2:231-1502(-)
MPKSLGDRLRAAAAKAEGTPGERVPNNNSSPLSPSGSQVTPRTAAAFPKTIKVFLIDGSSKTLALTPEITVRQVCNSIAAKLDARWPSSYALFEVWEDGVRTRLSDKQKLAHVVVKRADLENKYRDLLLDPPRIEFRQWLYFQEADREMVLLEFADMRHQVLTGALAHKPQETIGLGALCLQHDFGDHSPDVHVVGFLTRQGQLGNFVPDYVTKDKPTDMVESLLFGMHSKLVGMSNEQSALEYLVQVATWPTFGMTSVPAQWINKHCSSEFDDSIVDMATEGLFGVNEQGLHWMTVDSQGLMEVMKSWEFAELNSWASSDKHFGFVVGDLDSNHRLVFATEKGGDLSSLVQGYIDALVNRRDRSMSTYMQDEEEEESSSNRLSTRSRSSMDLRGIGAMGEEEFDIWANLPFQPLQGAANPVR